MAEVLNAFRHQRSLHCCKHDQAHGHRHVLNAFRHQRSLHGHRARPAPGAGRVLNAFRHQRSLHRRRPGGSPPTSFVLNAFRHQRSLHAVQDVWQGPVLLCSTPFGIRGLCTSPRPRPPRPNVQCSTPFGIRGLCTRARSAAAGCWRGAQRLSASEVSARADADDGAARGRVLNAFRHQRSLHRVIAWSMAVLAGWCSTPFGIRGLCTRTTTGRPTGPRCAQRLSASEVSAPLPLHAGAQDSRACSTPFGIRGLCTSARSRRRTRSSRAQRLSASEVSARHGRHQPDVAGDVLNAFRHQRSLHSSRSGRLPTGWTCSTPFGIRGLCTRLCPPTRGGSARVLNAFRHQRSLHGRRRRPAP